jgi:hypothetical protein
VTGLPYGKRRRTSRLGCFAETVSTYLVSSGHYASGLRSREDEGRPREQSQLTSINDADETVAVGSVIEADMLGYQSWKVVEVREDSGLLMSLADADGEPIPLGGTLVCRGVR